MDSYSTEHLLDQVVKKGKLHIHYKEPFLQQSCYKFKFIGDSPDELHIIMGFNSNTIREGLERILTHYDNKNDLHD